MMITSTNPVPALVHGQHRPGGWKRRGLLACGLTSAALSAAPAFGSPAVAFKVDSSARLAGNGLVARPTIGNPASPFAANKKEHVAAEVSRKTDFTEGALASLDSGHRDQVFQFSVASPLGDDRLVLHSRLHLTRQAQGAGASQSASNPYLAFPELALAYRLRHDLAIGAEYRFRPDNRNPAGPFGQHAREGAWKDLFVAWSPISRLSLTASYVDLGRLTPASGGARQIGRYLSAEFRY